MSEPLLEIKDLAVTFDVEGTAVVGVREASFSVGRNEVVAVVGESGSGKTVTAMSILGLLPKNAEVAGSIKFEGRELLGLKSGQLRDIRGAQIAMIFQDPVAALDPVFTAGFQLGEVVRLQDPKLPRAAVKQRVVELMELVEIPDAADRVKNYPHQFSGGQCQRLVIAMALAREPKLLIADEPTTALDVTVQAEILDTLRRVQARIHSSILLITHNMGVVADLADRVVVMRSGDVVEVGECEELFAHPRAEYTRELLAAVPKIGARGAGGEREAEPDKAKPVPALEAENLTVEYAKGRVKAVDSASLTVNPGEIVGLVGESGSGKTTIGKAALGLAPISAGSIRIDGQDIATLNRAGRQALRRRVGMVFQNPATSLNPRYSVLDTVIEPLNVIAKLGPADAKAKALDLLAATGVSADWSDRYPHELSGGQRQRVAIARAIALDPILLIADEPTSALDVSVQAQVLDLFRELQARLGFACLFISHDLAVVDSLCDRVAVMWQGRIVEQGERAAVLQDPQDPYTRKLLASAPVPDPAVQRRRQKGQP